MPHDTQWEVRYTLSRPVRALRATVFAAQHGRAEPFVLAVMRAYWSESRDISDPDQLAALPSLDDQLRDPDSENADQTPAFAKNPARSIKPELAVIVGICTHLGCSPTYVPELQPQAFDSEWQGGFYCPCHNSRFDLAGRVYQGVPAPSNLEVPPYHFVDDARVIVGIPPEGAA